MSSQNLELIEEYLTYRLEVDQLKPISVENERGRLAHLVIWLGDSEILDTPSIRPVFAEYLKTGRRDGRDKPLSAEYSRKTINAAKRFLRWIRDYKEEYRSLSPKWIDTLRPPRRVSEKPQSKGVELIGYRFLGFRGSGEDREMHLALMKSAWPIELSRVSILLNRRLLINWSK